MYLQKMIDIWLTVGKSEPFPCIKDLAKNGLSQERFKDGDHNNERK
jgi:hypothetical protein